METDSTAPENTDQAVYTPDEQVPAQARSYECTFFKRGFSNAQALGGHMNMHRKDKAKLKQASNKLMDIPESTPLYSPIPINTIQTLQSKSTEEKSMTKRPWTFSPEGDAPSSDETHLGQLRQLPLFDETASNNENQEQSSHVGTNTGKGFLSVQESAGPEIDLELRLGHEPQNSSAATGMKKFF